MSKQTVPAFVPVVDENGNEAFKSNPAADFLLLSYRAEHNHDLVIRDEHGKPIYNFNPKRHKQFYLCRYELRLVTPELMTLEQLRQYLDDLDRDDDEQKK